MRTRAECSMIRMENWMAMGITLRETQNVGSRGINGGIPLHCATLTIMFTITFPFSLYPIIPLKLCLPRKGAINKRLFKNYIHPYKIFSWETWQWTSNIGLGLLLLPIFSHLFHHSSFSLGSCCQGNTPLEFYLSTLAVAELHMPFPPQGGC